MVTPLLPPESAGATAHPSAPPAPPAPFQGAIVSFSASLDKAAQARQPQTAFTGMRNRTQAQATRPLFLSLCPLLSGLGTLSQPREPLMRQAEGRPAQAVVQWFMSPLITKDDAYRYPHGWYGYHCVLGSCFNLVLIAHQVPWLPVWGRV